MCYAISGIVCFNDVYLFGDIIKIPLFQMQSSIIIYDESNGFSIKNKGEDTRYGTLEPIYVRTKMEDV